MYCDCGGMDGIVGRSVVWSGLAGLLCCCCLSVYQLSEWMGGYVRNSFPPFFPPPPVLVDRRRTAMRTKVKCWYVPPLDGFGGPSHPQYSQWKLSKYTCHMTRPSSTRKPIPSCHIFLRSGPHMAIKGSPNSLAHLRERAFQAFGFGCADDGWRTRDKMYVVVVRLEVGEEVGE